MTKYKNKYGVKGMLGVSLALGQYFIPNCCMDCKHREIETDGEYNQYVSGIYCNLNLRMPIKKGICKKQAKLT